MPTWLKVLLIVLAVIVLGLGALGAIGWGIYTWWQKEGSGLIATIDEGKAFGADKDRTACVNEAVARIKREGGFTGAVKVRLFFDECLKAAKPVPGFCDNVPAPSSILKSATWLDEMNQKYGLTGIYEKDLLAEIQKTCEADAGRR
jgi:hypothetical protein